MAAAARRLRSISAAVTAATPGPQLDALQQAEELATANRLVPADFPADVIRELMVAGGHSTVGAKVQRVGGTTETERRWAVEIPRDIELGVPPAPLVDAGGAVTAEQMRHLQSLEVAAAAEGRYEDAVYLQRLQQVIDPEKPQLSYEQCAPEAPEAAAQFFLDNGFVIIRGALPPERLTRVQAAWGRFAGPAREAWEEHKRHCHGIARHYHDQVEEGWTQVARKWYGVTDEHLQPDHYGTAPPPMVETVPGSNIWHNGKGFLEADEAFIDVVRCCLSFSLSLCCAPTTAFLV
jgi:hypothetical protein